MSKRSRLLFKALANGFVVMALAACLGYFSLSQLKKNAKSIVEDTLPGLSDAGAANAYLGDASRTLMLIVTDDVEKQKKIVQDIVVFSQRTTTNLDNYGSAIFTDEDRSNFEAVITERRNYNTIRDHVVSLALAGNKEEALKEYNEIMMPSHIRLKQAGDRLFAYNMNEGKERGRRIMTLCSYTQIGLAVGSVVIFLLGFFIGLFK
jgi:methyl-accepting chemotaxis protein